MDKKHLSVLRATGYFDDFSESLLISLFEENPWRLKTYGKNAFIHMENETCRSWDILLDGRVVIKQIDRDGKILTLTEFGTGDAIGGNTLFSKRPFFPMSIFAKSAATVLHLEKDFVITLCLSSRTFLVRFLEGNSDKALVLSDKIKTISHKSIRSSLIDFLIYEYCLQENRIIRLPMTKKDLAERLGVQRTSLSRELAKMRKEGLIDFDPKHIHILDPALIENI